MRIKLRFDLPVNSEHGMTKGRILDVSRYVPVNQRGRGGVAFYVVGNTGVEVGVLSREAEILPEEDTQET